MKRYNLHTHTWRCKHATGEVMDYAREAAAAGLSLLGISDHSPLPDGRWKGVRMDMEELGRYLEAIEDASRAYPQLQILKAMECEWKPEYESFYREELLGRHGLNYLVCAVHYFPMEAKWQGVYGGVTNGESLRSYTDHMIASMRSGLYAFVAHPDVFANSYLEWDSQALACSRAILEVAQDLKIPLEINGYGMRKERIKTPSGKRLMYPWAPFWEVAAEYDMTVVINSDAHRPEDVAANLDEGRQWAEHFGLTLADPLELIGSRG